ncbi:MAG: hypothetical protein LUH07_08955, partial [Lachnospiraceae bacterium]|nr:hypothetical protein [Lachnospiraceae bacterium]
LQERLDALKFDQIVVEDHCYQEAEVKSQGLEAELIDQGANHETLEDYKEEAGYMRYIRENAAYLQGLKDGMALLAFAVGDGKIKLYDTDLYKLVEIDPGSFQALK